MLLTIRSKNIPHPLELCPPGGKIDNGENSHDAGERETLEEIALETSNSKKFGEYINRNGHLINLVLTLIDKNDLTKTHNFNRNEVEAVCSIPIKTLQSYLSKIEMQTSDIKYKDGIHLEKFKETDGFIVKHPEIRIKASDLTFIAGNTDLEELKMKPQGVIELFNSVLCREDLKELLNSPTRIALEGCKKLNNPNLLSETGKSIF